MNTGGSWINAPFHGDVRILKVEEGRNPNGKHFFKVTYQNTSGECHGQKYFTGGKGLNFFAGIYTAIGVDDDMSTDQWMDCELHQDKLAGCLLKITLEDDVWEGKSFPKVKRHEPINEDDFQELADAFQSLDESSGSAF